MRRVLVLAAVCAAVPVAAAAHKLNVFASADCEAVTVEASFSGGRKAKSGDVKVMDGDNVMIKTLSLQNDGTARIPLESVDHSGGLLIVVDTGGHDNYWILTPEDIARQCGS